MRTPPNKQCWIAVDWGTSNLRAWSMNETGKILSQVASDAGMASLKPAEFEPTLIALISPWLNGGDVPVIACGMVGARQGWVEAPYVTAPCPVTFAQTVKAPTADPRLDVRIIPGICQNHPPDVMRGEETQIAGYLTHNPDFDGVLCLPGTHTKWVHVSAGEIVSFRTFMTGELFTLLSERSVLRHSVDVQAWDSEAFSEALDTARSRPESLAARLFTLRAADLLHGQSGATVRAGLSGLLIGAELVAARPYWLGQSVVVIGESDLTSIYATALVAQGVEPAEVDGESMTLAGLAAAYAACKDAT